MCSNLQRITIVTFIGLLLVGCATPQHTNTLIFGTNTKLALDISQSPTNLPSVTFGYKREEAVWMPLVANIDKDGKPCDVSTNKPDCLFQGKDTIDGRITSVDTYSVLASFGAKFNGEAVGSGAPSAKAGGGLAQFFATGIAARKLAETEGATKLFSIPPETDVPEEIKQAAIEGLKQEYTQIDQIIDFVDDGSGNVDDGKIKSLTKDKNKRIESFSGKKLSELRKELVGRSRIFVHTLSGNI